MPSHACPPPGPDQPLAPDEEAEWEMGDEATFLRMLEVLEREGDVAAGKQVADIKEWKAAKREYNPKAAARLKGLGLAVRMGVRGKAGFAGLGGLRALGGAGAGGQAPGGMLGLLQAAKASEAAGAEAPLQVEPPSP